jgi:predicted nuclease of predicted toxin-antitoxin system
MRIYLDEDIASNHLRMALQKGGHEVIGPRDIGLLGKSDVVQFTHATENTCVLLTGNHRDFRDLHDLIMVCAGSHSGILAIRKDNDKRRDMTPHQTVVAIGNVGQFITALKNRFIYLNDWR